MNVEFSVKEVNLVNLFDEKGAAGDKQKHPFYVSNRFGSSKKVRIALSKTSHPDFHLLSRTDECCLAAGLKLPVVLQHTPVSAGAHTGEIHVYVNEQLSITVPIQALPPSSCIEVDSTTVDFGRLVPEHQITSQRFTVCNRGARDGGFSLTHSLPHHFTLSATEGTLRPGQTLEIQVELVCKQSGPFKEEIIVVPSDEASAPITLTLCGELVTRQLQLLDTANSNILNKISFSDTYYGTVVSRKALLYNASPVATQYMAVLDRGGLGSVAGVDMSEGLAMACTSGGLGQNKWREQGDAPEQETVVSLNPPQGSLGPYQKIVVEFLFMPRILKSGVGWSQHQGIPLQRDYSLFVHFLQVGISTGSSVLEVALTGRACPVQMSLQPQGIINFGACNTGTSSTIDLQVLNESQVLPIEYACRGLAHYKSTPRSGRLLPGEVTCLSVTFTPRQMGRLNCKLNIDVMSTRRETGGKIKNGAVYTAIIDLRGVGGVTSARKKDKKIKFAHSNDLSTSVRPHDERNKGVIITPYTKTPRHSYIDPDYSLTEEEEIAQAQHKNMYTGYIRDQQAEREWQERNRSHTGGLCVDMNMAPAQGLTSPVISTTDLVRREASKRREPSTIMTNTDVVKATEKQLEFVAVCPSKPANGEMAAQCKKTLSPLELSQITIDPGVMDFGSVVVNSIAELNLSIKNHTSNHISLKMKLAGSTVTCTSCYGNKSTLQLIVPPVSYTQLPLSLSHKKTGIIERSIEYTVNGQVSAHLPVKASVTQLSLLLSTNTLSLTEPPLARQSSGLLGSVVISNPHSIPVFFRWLAKEGVETSIFTMLHPSGYVPANGSLECGFVCLPSYMSPKTAQFLLDDGRDSLQDSPTNILSLVTEFKKPVCNIREKRILFGTIPLNLTTTRTMHIDNTGDCHAYYKVLDSSPHPGLRVFPESGMVPRGGAASLHVLLCPETTGTIDIRVVVGLRDGKTLGLRLAGLVEQPTLTVDQELFRFGSVFCGAKATQSFTVTNKGSSSAELTFNLAHLPDFSLLLPSSEDPYNEPAVRSDGAGTYSLNIPGKSSATCKLEFCPKDVAAYDFLLPLLVNGLKAPAPPPSPWPPSRTSSYIAHSQGTGLSLPSLSLTPTRRVLATALRPPLVVPNLQFDFELTGDCDKLTQHHKSLTLSNVSGEAISWTLGKTAEYTRVEDGTFQLVFPSGQSFQPPVISLDPSSEQEEGAECLLGPGQSVSLTVLCRPAHHGKFSATLPLIVNGNTSQPYRTLVLTAHLPTSSISVTPSCIDILPVPLGISLAAQFTVFVQGFTQPVELDIAVPVMREGVCFSVCFPGGSRVESGDKVELPCTLEFSSTHPVSISDTIIFSDKTTGKQKVLPFTVCADNSLFSVYKFLAQNVHISSVTLASNIPTFVLHSQDFEGSGRSSSVASFSSQGSVVKDTALGVNTSTTFSEMFHQDCVSAVCRWLSAYGWSDGIKCITLPSDLRRKVGNDLPKPGLKQRSSISTSRGLLVDMLTHLCGRVPPGIPLNLPPCTTASEKVNQQYSTLNTIISFLKNHGGLLWSVVPEALLDWCDYRQWLSDVGGKGSVGFQPGGEEEFNDLSNQAWTHLLMQIVKILLLPRAISHISKSIKDSVSQNGSSVESNVYSKHERVLLAWLNHHYTAQRGKLFTHTEMSLTEVLNFDVDLMDCTVFACVLVAYCPFLVESHLCHLFTEPVSHEQCTHNAIVLIQALRHAGIDYDLQPTDLVSADPISLLLFTMFLCQRLPAFKTKSKPIVFEGALNTNIKNQVQLTNPSTKSLDYHILIRGGAAGDFTVQDNSITVRGRQTCQVTVTYHTCCLSPTESTLLLVARGGRAVAGSTLAFKLVGHITSFKPQSTVSLTAYQYECQSVNVKVVNTYRTAGNFKVTFYEMDDKTFTNSLSAKSRKRLNSSTTARVPSFVLLGKNETQVQQFHCALPMVTISSNEEKLIPVKFVPLKTTPLRCFMVLSDPSVGDLVMSLTSTIQPPRPSLPHTNHLNPHTLVNAHTHTLHLKVHAGQAIEEELVIHSSNKAFESAVLEMSQWRMSEEELRRRQLTQSLRYASLSTAIAALGLETTTKKYLDDHDHTEDSEMLYFTVQVSDQEHFAMPEKISVPAKNSGTAVLPVRFYSEMEGQFECYITLRSKHDVRVLVIETTVLATGRHAHLQFNTHAMQPLTQDIPLVNPSTADWPLIASLTGSGFSGPESLIAHALSTTNYPLTFDPHIQGTVEGELHLLNNSDDSEHVFHLTGIADKPLAQDHITLHANAKQSMTHILHVPNRNERTTVFRVESDLDFISGPSTITVGGGDVVDYCLNVLPTRHGTFSGAIAFITEAVSRPHSYDDGLESTEPTSDPTATPYRVWFQLEFVVGAAPPDHVLPMSTTTLSSTTLQLTIPNAHSQAICLQALVEGHGLSGPASLGIEAHGEASYPLTFTPTLHGKTEGRVVFSEGPEGEFWYQLVLSAEDPQPISLPTIQCELGRTELQTITLSNPLDEPALFSCDNSNTRHFIVTGLPSEGQVVVDPHSSADVSVIFNPSALGPNDHTTNLAFTNKQIGRQVFNLKGEGIPPTSMDPITINAAIDSNTVHIINFTNPLDHPTHFSVTLSGEDLDAFCLLLKRSSSILLHPGISLDVPLMFAPEAVYRHNITVAIVADMNLSQEDIADRQPLCWKYAVVGQPQLRPFTPGSAPKISCPAKERLEKTVEVSLASSAASVQVTPNSSDNEVESSGPVKRSEGNADFTFQLVCCDPQYEELIEQCTGLRLIRQTRQEDKGVCLEFSIIFAPSKSFSCVCELQVTSIRGGVWLFPLHLSATPASPDDTITLEAKGLHQESRVGFRLTSGSQHPAPFTAHLAPGSDPDLVVSPTSGTLSPVNTKGTLFCITYKPTAYGRNHRATLIVQSETNEWRYKIDGQPPSYSRQAVPSKVQHKLDSPMRLTTMRNFVTENIQNINVHV